VNTQASVPRRRSLLWRGTTVLRVVVIAGVLAALGSSAVAIAASSAPFLTNQQWRKDIQALPLPGTHCYNAPYPHLFWTAVPCLSAPPYPYIPKHTPPPSPTVGNGTDYSALVSGTLSSSTGSFDSILGAPTERGQRFGTGPLVPGIYSLQLDARPFTSPACATALIPAACSGWQQFIYSSTFNRVFMQYWMLSYGRLTCPGGWHYFAAGPTRDCWKNSFASPWPLAVPTIPQLINIHLTGVAGLTDHVVMAGLTRATAVGASSVLNLRAGWKGVEFSIVGDCCGSRAVFSPGTTIQVRTTTHSGTTAAPTCVYNGWTGETNNLYLNGAPSIGPAASPAIVDTQSTTPGPYWCAMAHGNGDIHIKTFGTENTGTYYDFQSTGSHVLATTGPNFTVENWTVSGAPTWPNRAVNVGIGAKVGPSRVAVCLPPAPLGAHAVLKINGHAVSLASGGRISLPDGAQVSFTGTSYVISDGSGDSVTAAINADNPNYINASVGLGEWPEPVRGLLANASNGNPLSIAARNGTILTAPWTFSQLYGLYANSWQVSPSQSLLSVCGGDIVNSNPSALAYASELSVTVREAAQKICEHAGVKAELPLADCEVDVAWLGPTAAAIYRGQTEPATIGQIQPPVKVQPTPRPIDITGVGAQSSQSLFDQFSADYNAGIAASAPHLYSFDAVNPVTGAIGDDIQLKTGAECVIPRPGGSSAGITALTTENGTTSGHPCIDFARSDRPRVTTDPVNLQFVPFARDGVTYATNAGSNAPADLTTVDLARIYQCTVTNWDQVGGKNAPIHAFLPETFSGTRSYFLNAIGVTAPGSCVSWGQTKKNPEGTIAENEGTNPDLQGPDAIYPYSIGDWIAQVFHSAPVNASGTCTPEAGQNQFGCDVHGTSTLGDLNKTAPTITVSHSTQLNPKFSPDFVHEEFVVVQQAAGEPGGVPSYLQALFGPGGWLLTTGVARDDILDYGFLSLP
jgi:ABC-type phosphate transport system substrate-binding protein